MGFKQISKHDFKIAKIVDEYTVVINGGSDHGLAVGDSFEIYDPGAEIYDPDTKEPLGKLEYVKAKIVAKQVYPKMTVCGSAATISPIVDSIAKSLIISKTVELNVNSEDISGGYDDVVRVGDPVRKIAQPKKDLPAIADANQGAHQAD